MSDPPQIIEWPPPRGAANAVQATSAALGVVGVVVTAAGAAGSTSEALLGAGRDVAAHANMLLSFGTVPGSLRWGIIITAVSVLLNIVSLWLRYQSGGSQGQKAPPSVRN
jgi:hypothetical protein